MSCVPCIFGLHFLNVYLIYIRFIVYEGDFNKSTIVYYKGLSPLHIEIDASLMVAIYIQQ